MQVTFNNTSLELIEDARHEFLLSNKEVALGYGTTIQSLNQAKRNNENELLEGKHWLRLEVQTKGGKQLVIHWTKKGVVRLGFFIKSQQAKAFRDWAEDYIVNSANQSAIQPAETTGLLVELLKTQQQQNDSILQVLNNQTQLFKNMQKQLEDTTRSVHYNSDTLLATQEAIDINRKRSVAANVYPSRAPQIDHKGSKPPKPTYLQKKILIAIEGLISIKDVYENIDGEDYYRLTIEEISGAAMKKSNYSYICKHINFLVQHGYLRKVKLSSVCVVYALAPKQQQTKGKK